MLFQKYGRLAAYGGCEFYYALKCSFVYILLSLFVLLNGPDRDSAGCCKAALTVAASEPQGLEPGLSAARPL